MGPCRNFARCNGELDFELSRTSRGNFESFTRNQGFAWLALCQSIKDFVRVHLMSKMYLVKKEKIPFCCCGSGGPHPPHHLESPSAAGVSGPTPSTPEAKMSLFWAAGVPARCASSGTAFSKSHDPPPQPVFLRLAVFVAARIDCIPIGMRAIGRRACGGCLHLHHLPRHRRGARSSLERRACRTRRFVLRVADASETRVQT